MEHAQRTKLKIVRTQLVDDIEEVQPLLDVLVETRVLSPQTDVYQKVLAGSFARERTRLLLDALPTLGARAFDAFVEGLRRSKPHLADLLEEVSAEDVCDGAMRFPPTLPCVELASRVQNKLRKTFVQIGRKAKVVDHRRGAATVGLDELFVTISTLTFDESQARFKERKRRSGTSARRTREESAKRLASKTFSSRCQEAVEQRDVGQLFRKRAGAGIVDSCLVVGPAGTGKTLLLQRVAVSWAEGKAVELSQFQLVVLITGRDKDALNCETAVEMLGYVLQRQYKLTDAERAEIEKYMEMNSEKVLVLLDSADEGGEAWVGSKALEMLFDRRGLEDCTFVVTSRPCPLAYDLVPLCEHRFYLVGFNDRRLDELLCRRLGEDGLKVAEKLKEPSRRHVRELMKETPLIANMVAELALEGEDFLPSSCTQIYKAMAANMVQRQTHKTAVRQKHRAGEDMFACLPEDVKERLDKLGQVALTGLRKRQFVFNAEEVVSSCGGEVLDYGFLEEFEQESMIHGTRHEVEFRHLTWAEFFAAYALNHQLQSKTPRALFTDEIGVDEKTEPFWKFVCGLVDPKHLKEVLESLQAVCLAHRSQLNQQLWVRLACSCISEASHQLASDSPSLEEDRACVMKAALAVIPRKVDMSNSRMTVADAQALSLSFCHSPHVTELDASQCGLKADHCKALGSGLNSLKNLVLNGNAGLHSDCGLAALAQAIAEYGAPRLSVLLVKRCKLNVDDCVAIQLLINTVTSLQCLILIDNSIGTSGLSKLQGSLSRSKLQRLGIAYNGLDSGAGRILAGIVHTNQHLVNLYVTENQLGNLGVSDLLEGVKDSRSLQWIDLSSNSVDDDVIRHVSACMSQRSAHQTNAHGAISPQKPLTLKLHENSISRVALEELAQNTHSNKQDRVECGSFVVKGGAVNEKNFQKLFNQQAQHCSGGQLNLRRLGMDDLGAKQISAALSVDRSLTVLDLSENAIGDSGAEALGNALRVNTSLRGLGLARNRVGPVGFASMAKDLAESDSAVKFIGLRMNPVFPAEARDSDECHAARKSLGKLISTSNLRCLVLSKTGLGDMELEVIGEALTSTHCSISFLGLKENIISDQGAAMLFSGLEKNTSIQYLDLSYNEISNTGAKRIGRCLEHRAEQGVPLQQVWMEGNPAEPEAYTDCMVNAVLDSYDLAEFMNMYL